MSPCPRISLCPSFVANPYSLPVRSCTGSVTFPLTFDVLISELDAGPATTITGPNGLKQLTASGSYSAKLGGGAGRGQRPLHFDPGAYIASGGAGPKSVRLSRA